MLKEATLDDEEIGYFYFKFQKGNKGYKKWVENRESLNEDMPLSIYYGLWKVEDYDRVINSRDIARQSKDQIKIFFNLKENFKIAPVYFFIFYESIIEIFKSKSLDVFNNENELYKDEGGKSPPKSILVSHFKTIKKEDAPEYFAMINSNQKYNRRTISEFKKESVEYDLAEAIVQNDKIDINSENFIRYLSPVQFETLAFLIFNYGENGCSSFRGGTLEEYDLKIYIKKAMEKIPVGNHWVQVKLNKEVKPSDKYYLFTNNHDKCKHDKVLDFDWIKGQLNNRPELYDWLSKTIFESNYYNCHLKGI